MNLTRDAFYEIFEVSPGDFAAYGAMGDEMEQLGYQNLAHAFRWMWKRQKFPHLRSNYATIELLRGRAVPKRFRFAWYGEGIVGWTRGTVVGVYPVARLEHHSLPPVLLNITNQHVFPSHKAAVMWLADRLAGLRAVWEIE